LNYGDFMIQNSKTIGELQAEIEAALSRLKLVQLPAGLEALRYLAPPKGLAANISLRRTEGNRQIKRTADVNCWDPQSCEAILSYELENETSIGADENDLRIGTAENLPADKQICDLIIALDAAERDNKFKGFVGIKAFRDQFLVRRFSWAENQSTRHYALA